ncbi:MAG: amidohydrolase [Gemmatimonadetes bacterium]|nr:amidohydrolase [Gemmatimonadota bacterium]MCC6773867.1 amidohydrolase [Gemmatimonadaceae bacterium]
MGLRFTRGIVALASALALAGWSAPMVAQDADPAPRRAEGDGPFDRLIIRGATLIDGQGGPPRGPVDIVVEKNRIVQIADVGFPGLPVDASKRPKGPAKEIDANGMYVMPGLIDLHVHTCGKPKAPQAEYCYKLWLAHGVTAVRGVPFGGFEWSLSETKRANANEITAPRMYNYQRPGSGAGWGKKPINTPEDARAWVRWAKEQGIDGLKVGAHPPEIMAALLDEAKKQGLNSTAHLQQTGVVNMNALDAAKLGLGAVTHYYGIFEAMYEGTQVQPYPADYNYSDEQWRFGQVARQWNLVKPRSEKWNAFLKVLKEHDVTLDPTMTTYMSGRDLMKRRTAEWHEQYTLPSLWDFYTPNRENHGAYFYNWTTWDEVAWKKFYQVWMEFINDYKNMGGRVTPSTDAGFIYNTYGFSYIEELEIFQEAGFHPLEVIRGATLHAAQELNKVNGQRVELGTVATGMLADMVIVPENPIANFKVLYGTGFPRLNDKTGKVERVGGVKYTIKDGIVYDAKKLLEDVAKMVEKERKARGITKLPVATNP